MFVLLAILDFPSGCVPICRRTFGNRQIGHQSEFNKYQPYIRKYLTNKLYIQAIYNRPIDQPCDVGDSPDGGQHDHPHHHCPPLQPERLSHLRHLRVQERQLRDIYMFSTQGECTFNPFGRPFSGEERDGNTPVVDWKRYLHTYVFVCLSIHPHAGACRVVR